VAGGPGRPHDLHWDALLVRVVDNIGGAPEPAGGLAVPNGNEDIAGLDDETAGGHMRLLGGLHKGQPVDVGGLREKLVVRLAGRHGRKAVAVALGWDHDLKRATVVKDRAGEQLVGAVGQARDADEIRIIEPFEKLAQSLLDECHGLRW
jgi:hypothetical protein